MRRLLAFLRNARGVTAIEFAIVGPIAMMIIMALGDLGYRLYVTATLSGEMQKAARDATLEGSADQLAAIDGRVEDAVKRIAKNADMVSSRLSYTSFSDVHRPEKYTDLNGNNQHDAGECFEDEDGDGQWDSDVGREGSGGPDDVVLYTVTVTYPRIFPMASLLGWSNSQTIQSTTTLKNQPYGQQVVPQVVGCPT